MGVKGTAYQDETVTHKPKDFPQSLFRDQTDLPGLLVITQEYVVRIQVWSSLPTVIETRYRILTKEGRLVSTSQLNVVTADRGPNAFDINIRFDGFLQAIAVYSGVSNRGRCYCVINYSRITPVGTVVESVLARGYANDQVPVSFHPFHTTNEDWLSGPGALQSFGGTNPAAGLEMSETVPVNARWKIRAVRLRLDTAAAVPVRTVNLLIDNGADFFYQVAAATTQAAGITRDYIFAPFAGAQPADAGSLIYITIPNDLQLLEGWRIRTSTTNLAAADDFGSPIIKLEEWIEVD